jgi:hypothetical protein
VKPLASIASNRLETWIRRISSTALFVSGIEVVANAIGQSGFTNPRSDLVLAIVILSAAAFIVSAVLFDRSRPWGLVHGLVGPCGNLAGSANSRLGFSREWV